MSSSSAKEFARLAARQSALALADSAGFDEVQHSCMEILADLLLRYVQEMGAASHHYAELAGRSDTNSVDVALALNDMGTSIGQLREFMRKSPEVPFEQNISAFPQRKKSRPPPTFLDRGEAPPPHIPSWLPALPDRHTYQATPVYPGHEKDPQRRQMQLTEQRQAAETAAVRLQARLSADSNLLLAAKLPKPEGAEEAAAEAARRQQHHQQQQQQQGAAPAAAAGAAAAAGNPFFAAPWGEPLAEQQAQQAPVGAAPAAAPATAAAAQPAPSQPGPTVEWEQAAWEAGGGAPAAGAFAAQQLFATADWKAAQQRRARIATGGRAVREAFGEAYEEQAAARAGKRKRVGGGGILPPPTSDPTRARVEGILAAHEAAVAAPAVAAGREDLMQEQI